MICFNIGPAADIGSDRSCPCSVVSKKANKQQEQIIRLALFLVILSLWTPSRLVTDLTICSAPCRAGTTTVSTSFKSPPFHKPQAGFSFLSTKLQIPPSLCEAVIFLDEVERTLTPTPRRSPFTFINGTMDYIPSISPPPSWRAHWHNISAPPSFFFFFCILRLNAECQFLSRSR